MPVVMGVDSSTQSCKVELRDSETGQCLGLGAAPHPPTTPPVSEQNPTDWWNALKLALNRAIDDAGLNKRDVKAISVAAQCHGLVLMDSSGHVLRPVKLWNDLTSAPEASCMVAETGPDFWVDCVGSVPTAAFTITKLAWMASHEPRILAASATACLPHDWLTWRLTGRFVTDRSDASGTGYYSGSQSCYRHDILERFASVGDISLPEVLGPHTPVGRICTSAAEELGLGRDVLVGPGMGDQHAAALGLGLSPTDVGFSLGTSGVVMTVSEDPVHDHQGIVDGVCDATGRFLPLVCTLNAVKVTDWFRDLLAVGYDEFDSLALSVPPSERTLTLAAFFDGERRPNLPLAVGLLAGLTPHTTRAQLARAGVDGVVMGLLEGYDALVRCGLRTDGRVVAFGGGASSAAYRQSLADFLVRPVLVLEESEATARGACVQAEAILSGTTIDQVRDAWRPMVSLVTQPGEHPPDNVREAYRTLAAFRGMDRTPG